jgi:hypothetical protein
MINNDVPTQLSISVSDACMLSLECWRLRRISELLKDSERGVLGHAVRHIAEILKDIGIETVDFAGRTYDPGMVPEVVDIREDDTLLDSGAIIDETVAPTVTWRGQVVEPGQIIVKHSARRPEFSEVRS